MKQHWTRIASLAELAAQGKMVVKQDGAQIALFQTRTGVYAVSNRCPHEGYPLVEGTLNEKCQLTCNWHGWTFDLESGETVQGRDRVKRYPVRVEGDDIFAEIIPEAPHVTEARAWQDIDEAVAEYDYERLARGLARLEKSGTPLKQAVVRVMEQSGDGLERGFGHAHAGMADWLALADRYPSEAMVAILEGLGHFSWDMVFSPGSPLPLGTTSWDEQAYKTAVEDMDETAAIQYIRGAVAEGLGFEALKPVLQDVVFRHYMGFGHAAIYLQKAGELIRRLGKGIEPLILMQLTRYFILASREDMIPEFRIFHECLREVAGAEAGNIPQDLTGLPVRTLLPMVARSPETPVKIWDRLLQASAEQLLWFDETLQDRTDIPIAQNVGYLDFTHAITFAEAVYVQASIRPDLWRSGLLQMACFVGRNAKFATRPASSNAVPATKRVSGRACTPERAGHYLAAAERALFDMDVGAYIYSVHRVKMVCAVKNLLPFMSDDTTQSVLAALDKFLTGRIRQHHPKRAVNQARYTVAKEG